jgi:uncharacterized membrane protein
MKRIAESIIIHRPCGEVFAYLENRSNDPNWMVSVLESHWLDPDGPTGIGRRGRMVMKIGGRRAEFIDEVTGYEPGQRIAHRTVQGPLQLNTACICEPSGSHCRATVIGEADRLVSGPLGRLVEPLLARGVRHSFRNDLARLKQILEAWATTPPSAGAGSRTQP